MRDSSLAYAGETKSLHKIIVNADDFGRDAFTNRRIIACFERGLISSATVMVNMPGFEEVVHWYALQAIKPKLGIHLNLDEGEPLSETFRTRYPHSKLFYSGSVFGCDRQYLQTIKYELKAQLEKLLASNIRPDHIDSHHHIHTHWPVAKVVVSLAEEYGIKNIRMAGNVLFTKTSYKRLYRYLLNRWLFQRRLGGGVRLFSYLERFMAERPDIGDRVIELMVHPGVDADYALLNSEIYRRFLTDCELISYSDG